MTKMLLKVGLVKIKMLMTLAVMILSIINTLLINNFCQSKMLLHNWLSPG